MESIFPIKELDVSFTFQVRPTSVPPDLRPEWRMSLLTVILATNCRGKRSSVARIHVLNWSLRNTRYQTKLLDFLKGNITGRDVIIRYEPEVNRALDLAIGEGLVVRLSGDRVRLAKRGVALVNDIESYEDCLTEERDFLERVGKSLTEQKVEDLIRVVV